MRAPGLRYVDPVAVTTVASTVGRPCAGLRSRSSRLVSSLATSPAGHGSCPAAGRATRDRGVMPSVCAVPRGQFPPELPGLQLRPRSCQQTSPAEHIGQGASHASGREGQPSRSRCVPAAETRFHSTTGRILFPPLQAVPVGRPASVCAHHRERRAETLSRDVASMSHSRAVRQFGWLARTCGLTRMREVGDNE
jgi:hypothetical protein